MSVNAGTTSELVEPGIAYVKQTNPAHIETYDPCSCVSFAKWKMDVSQSVSWGNAWNIKPTSKEPGERGLVLTSEGKGHIAYYTRIGDTLYLEEANYERCKTTTRQLNINSPVIRGFK